MRHRYVHAVRGDSPVKLEAATHLLTNHTVDPGWLSDLVLTTDARPITRGYTY